MVNILPALARLALGQEELSSLLEHLCYTWPLYLALKPSAYHRNQELPWYLGGCGHLPGVVQEVLKRHFCSQTHRHAHILL